ncbi:competence type IV pilus major pilin ComGC [Salirhabdus salicampi]|uniref:competence type IV pilus major pilin ComGC n=1 Tax=Salirhabdus salicampi TaxID=476102 RepID=UPI00266BC5C0|nr:competence type IV pilus major pilin ComGC [Salirhabdus salicampi]
MTNEKGYTLLEMLIVLLIISVLLMISVPNLTNSNSVINDKGCEAFVELVETQANLYRLDYGFYPEDLKTLMDSGYIKQTTCPDGTAVELQPDGSVSVAEAS